MSSDIRLLVLLLLLCAAPVTRADPLKIVDVDMRALDDPSMPGERLVTVRFRNESSGANAQPTVTAAVPTDFDIVPGSARGPGASVSYSPGGGDSFVAASDWNFSEGDPVTHLRWTLPGPMEPGVAGIVSFRVRPATE